MADAARTTAAMLVIVWLGLLVLTDGPPAVATVAMVPYALLLLLGASLLYPLACRGGLRGLAAVGAALSIPALWIAKECWAMSRIYEPGEALYYAVNPIALGLVSAAAAQIAVADLLLARRRTGRWVPRRAAVATLLAITIAALTTLLALRGRDPTAVFWSYVSLHRDLFGR